MKTLALIVFLSCALRSWAFSPNERVLFLGDSITHGGLYLAYIEMMTAGPEAPVILNGGISGDTCEGILKSGRLEWDVAARQPNRVFVMLGMNDVRRDLWRDANPSPRTRRKRDRAISEYAANLARIVDDLLDGGMKVVVMTPSPYDQYGEFDDRAIAFCNEPGLSRCADEARALAVSRGLPLIDIHATMTAILRSGREECLCGADRVHPGEAGSALIAAAVIKAETGDEGTIEDVAARICSDPRAPAAPDYAGVASELRRMAEYERLVRARGADVRDVESCDKALDDWVESASGAQQREERTRCAESFRKLRRSSEELEKQVESKRRAMLRSE